ncbi:MAG: bifunctional diaminohydroxyphosphoribosylaminopyrimidine deaminase/5-amino-6-(5-phosphoribosylamino)uracil reductase RibD [Candidatus Tectomicrobia bacterium]|uniref:Riboflavin biosynthesis protein RibD n=1 Tax=Tectimicrobiota bacterium TaxID=2528274 RepID=A0A932CMM3_UNCTE|nr:bifunctional diaminohydroxyphosphoribosylaminopyrimidine deaminase/5-amino-6-(5-phosphoribosylamino)uracil reductase RibD [Candidatus Tectomicrobia bacterium]
MQAALALALKARGRTSPNPLVGAVIIQDGRIVGRGYHVCAGAPHAEVVALEEAGPQAAGATLYVNLEPCCHWGRTPPCTSALIRSGIQRVVVGMVDPNPRVSGKGIEQLQQAGIEVEVGLLEERARRDNEAFIKYITTGQPFVILKSAVSLDGKIATASRQSRWITSGRSRLESHKLRDQVDAILVGIETVLADDPQLTTRLWGRKGRDARKIVVDSVLRIPLEARVLPANATREDGQAPAAGVIIATTARASSEKARQLEAKGAQVLRVGDRGGRVDLSELMRALGQQGIVSLLIEGGGEINAAALQAGLVDKVVFFIAPLLIGGGGAPGAVGGQGCACLEEAIRLERLEVKQLEADLMIQGYVTKR